MILSSLPARIGPPDSVYYVVLWKTQLVLSVSGLVATSQIVQVIGPVTNIKSILLFLT